MPSGLRQFSTSSLLFSVAGSGSGWGSRVGFGAQAGWWGPGPPTARGPHSRQPQPLPEDPRPRALPKAARARALRRLGRHRDSGGVRAASGAAGPRPAGRDGPGVGVTGPAHGAGAGRTLQKPFLMQDFSLDGIWGLCSFSFRNVSQCCPPPDKRQATSGGASPHLRRPASPGPRPRCSLFPRQPRAGCAPPPRAPELQVATPWFLSAPGSAESTASKEF